MFDVDRWGRLTDVFFDGRRAAGLAAVVFLLDRGVLGFLAVLAVLFLAVDFLAPAFFLVMDFLFETFFRDSDFFTAAFLLEAFLLEAFFVAFFLAFLATFFVPFLAAAFFAPAFLPAVVFLRVEAFARAPPFPALADLLDVFFLEAFFLVVFFLLAARAAVREAFAARFLLVFCFLVPAFFVGMP